MKELNVTELNKVSGGDIGVTITANVATADEGVFAVMVGQYLTGQLDAAGFAAAITAHADSFNNMKLTNIVIGHFTITPN